jgi:hypothetical protein
MSNTFVTPRVVSTIAQSRIDYNTSLTSVLQNFSSVGAPSAASISIEGVTGLLPGMLWYKSGSDTSDGQGRFFVYNGSEFTRNGIAAYRMPSISAANSAASVGSISYGDLILTGDNNLYIVNAANTGVVSVSASAQTLSGILASQFMRRDIDSNSTANVSFNSNAFVKLPIGNVAQRPSVPVTGMIRFNTSTSAFEGYDGSSWGTIGTQTFINDGTYLYYNGGLPVGIGTTTPSANLHVVGTGTLLRLETAGSEDQNGPALQFYQTDTTIVANQGYGGVEWRGEDSGNNGVRGYLKGFSTGSSGEFSVRLATQGSGASGPLDRVTINPAGNVGIGVINANTLLQVAGNISVSGGDVTIFNRGSNYLALGTNNREVLRITPTGNLAYGTTSPSSNVQINGSGNIFRLQTSATDTEGVTQRFHQTDTTIITDQSYGGIEWEGNDAGGAGLRGFVKGFADGNNGEFSVRVATQGSGASNPQTRMTVSSAGNVGIGTTTPSQQLEVVGNVVIGTQTNRATLSYTTNTSRNYSIPDAGSNASFVMTSGDQSLAGITTISSNGSTAYNFIIAHANANTASNSASGMNTADVELQALEFRYTGSSPNATMARIATVNYNTGGSGWFGVTSRYRTGLAFHTLEQNVLSEHMRITNLGSVGIGTTTPASKLQVVGEVTATDFNSTSDAAVKENIVPITSPLEKLLSINGVIFNFINEDKRRAGVIAQDVETVLPEAVSEKNGVKNVSYNQLIGLLVEAIKEQQNQITLLREYVFQNTSK